MEKFDPYHRWLGIPPHEQPPTLYRLLGLSDFESDREVITEASYRQIGHVKQYASGPHRDAATKVLNELAKAQVILLDPRKKTQYDISIQEVTQEEKQEAAVVIAPAETTVGPGASKETRSSTGIKPRQRKQSNLLPMLVTLAVLSFVLFTFGYWWVKSSQVLAPERVAESSIVTDAASLESADPPRPKANEEMLPAETAAAETIPTETTPTETTPPIETKEVEKVKPAKTEPIKNADFDVKPINKSNPRDMILKKPAPLGHAERVTSIAFSPDGKQLVSSSNDKTFKLWDVATDTELRTFSGHSGSVTSVAFSPDGRQIVSSGWKDQTLVLWDAQSGSKLQTFSGHSGGVCCVAYAANGQLIASSGEDGVRVWDPVSGRQLQSFGRGSIRVTSIAFSPDGKQIVSNSYDSIKLWDAGSGKQLQAFTNPKGRLHCLAFSTDGKLVIGSSLDKALVLWDVKSGQKLRTFTGHRSAARSIAFSPDSKQVASVSGAREFKIWDVASGKEIKSFQTRSQLLSVAFAPDGKRVVFGNRRGAIGVWEVGSSSLEVFANESEVVRSSKSAAGSIELDSNRPATAIAVKDDSLMTLRGHRDDIGSVAFFSDGKTLVSASDDQTLMLWDAETGQRRKIFAQVDAACRSLAISADDQWICIANAEGEIDLWDATSTLRLKTFSEHLSSVSCVAISPNDKFIASTSWGDSGLVKLFRVSNESVKKLGEGDYTSVTFSPNSRWVIAGSMNESVDIWSTSSGKLLKTLKGHTNAVLAVACSPSGKQVASGGKDRTIKVWAVPKVKLLQTLIGHTASVSSVSFSPDGKLIASGSFDNTVKLWDAASGKELRTLHGHNDRVRCVVFSPDGKRIVSSSNDQTIKIWDTSGVTAN